MKSKSQWCLGEETPHSGERGRKVEACDRN